MDSILRPRGRALPQAGQTWADGFAHMARIVEAALGDGPPVSQRTELFRPLPDDPMAWLFQTFPAYFQDARGRFVPLAPRHEEFWAWVWSLRPGEAQDPFIAIWPRGGGKSVTLELGSAVIAYFGLRRYVLYVCGTQKQADDHVSNVAKPLEDLGIERAVNKYGFSRGWSANRLRTADGFTQDAIGLDAASRGARFDFSRPDGIFIDEVDKELDSAATIERNITTLTQSILPMGDEALSIAGVQNLPHKDGLFAQLVDGRAEFLMKRYVSGPHPILDGVPEQDWYVKEVDPVTGRLAFRIPVGTPTWQRQDMAACTKLLNEIGPRAFEIECLNRVGRLSGTVFQRQWFPIVDDWPRGATLVRAWDFASTPEPGDIKKSKDPDWTVGLLLALWQGQFWVVDMQRVRLTSWEVEMLVQQTAQFDGRTTSIWLEEEGGSSGKSVTANYQRRLLVGYAVIAWHSTGSKAERAKNVSAAAQAGNVMLVRAHWNEAFLDEVSRFLLPGVHDDIVDALSLAHFALTLGQTILPKDFSLAKAVEGMTQRGVDARAQQAALLPSVAALWGMGEMGETWA